MASVAFWSMYYTDFVSQEATRTSMQNAVLILMHTLPVLLMITEWSFNQMPIEVRMLPLDIAIFAVYILINVVIDLSTNEPVYMLTDWINKPGIACVFTFVSLLAIVLTFILLWIITQKWKLPKFRQ